MKHLLLFIFLSVFYGTTATSQTKPGTENVEITLFSNGYTYPESASKYRMRISRNGLTRWNDSQAYTRTFFYPQQAGTIKVALKLKSPDETSKITVQLDSTGKKYDINVPESSTYTTLPIGSFQIQDARYHFLEIKGISKSGNYFPQIESILLSGPASQDCKFNLSQYKSAPATHLSYIYPKDSTISWFYNEVTVPVGVDATNAYYMTNGFSGGYAGIQLNSATERRFIFSIWSNYKTNDPKEIPSDYAITLVKKGKDVFTGEFGNEGSGGHSHLVFPWKQGTTYKILIGARAKGDNTIYSAYYAPKNGAWKLLAIWDKTKTGGKLLSNLYSFVENFGANGNDFFKADYGNQWICTPSGNWMELTQCYLTTTASPAKHQRYDYGAGVENNKFYMFTGGFKEMNNLAPHSLIKRQPNGMPPKIDFDKLPQG